MAKKGATNPKSRRQPKVYEFVPFRTTPLTEEEHMANRRLMLKLFAERRLPRPRRGKIPDGYADDDKEDVR